MHILIALWLAVLALTAPVLEAYWALLVVPTILCGRLKRLVNDLLMRASSSATSPSLHIGSCIPGLQSE